MGRTELLPFTPMAQNELYMRSWFDRRSSGQLCSALGTTASQDLAAVGGSHSLSEPMDFASLSLFRLIGSKHRSSPPSGSWRRPRRGSLPDVVGHLYQRAIGRDDPAILNYTLILVPLSRKSYCFCGILLPCGVNSGRPAGWVQDVGRA